MQTLGEKLKEIRKAAGLTQNDVAERIGFSFKVVSKWENNLSAPDVFTLHKLSKILNFSIDEILKTSALPSGEELIDVLDAAGVKTGQTANREEIHKKGYWHREVGIWIVNKKREFLLQRRAYDKDIDAGLWAICAGHVFAGESDMQAITRILKDEIGVSLDGLNNRYLITDTQKSKGLKYKYFKLRVKAHRTKTLTNKAFSASYLLWLDIPTNKLTVNQKEIAELKWAALPELNEMINSGVTVFNDKENAEIILRGLEENTLLVDVLDEQGRKTGAVQELSDAHEQGLWHREAVVFVGNSKMQLQLFGQKCYETIHPQHNQATEECVENNIKERIGMVLKNNLKPLVQLKLQNKDEYKTVNNRFAEFYFYYAPEAEGVLIEEARKIKNTETTAFDINEALLDNILNSVERELVKVRKS